MLRLLQGGISLALLAVSLFGQAPATARLVSESAGLNARIQGYQAGTRTPWAPLKILLRDWIESHLPANLRELDSSFPHLEAGWNAELTGAGLIAPNSAIESVDLSRLTEFPEVVTVKASIHVPCGTDTSVYVYRFGENGRVRLLAADGATDSGNELVDLQFSPPDPSGARLLYASWLNVQCASVWNVLDYRIFRISRDVDQAEPVFSNTQNFTTDDDVHVKLAPQELLIELTGDELQGSRRTYVLHYKVEANSVTRIDPIALQPQDFVHEWLIRSWPEMQSRSAASVQAWHELLHNDFILPEFDFVQPCQERPGFTQLAVEFSKIGGQELDDPVTVYFLVQGNGGYRYQMSDISLDRQSGCPGDAQHDPIKQPSLFKK